MRLIAIASLMAGCAFAQKAESPLPANRRGKNCGRAERRSHVYHERYDAARRAFVGQCEDRFSGKVRTNGTCLPSIPGYPHDEPGRFDRVYFQWMKDSMAGRAPHIDRSESHICMALPSASFIRALLSSMSVPT